MSSIVLRKLAAKCQNMMWTGFFSGMQKCAEDEASTDFGQTARNVGFGAGAGALGLLGAGAGTYGLFRAGLGAGSALGQHFTRRGRAFESINPDDRGLAAANLSQQKKINLFSPDPIKTEVEKQKMLYGNNWKNQYIKSQIPKKVSQPLTISQTASTTPEQRSTTQTAITRNPLRRKAAVTQSARSRGVQIKPFMLGRSKVI